jgi:hypothetical protein
MPSTLRSARVGDQLPTRLLGPARARRLDAIALVVPGTGSLNAYLEGLDAGRSEFEAWDGRVLVADPDGRRPHRLLVVDRYRQVYAVHDAADPTELPDAHALAEWFRFLATACPECGVIDDPLLSGPTL